MTQMSQLDQQVRDFRRGVEKRNHELEDELERVQKQLNERNSQVRCDARRDVNFASSEIFNFRYV